MTDQTMPTPSEWREVADLGACYPIEAERMHPASPADNYERIVGPEVVELMQRRVAAIMAGGAS